MSCWTSAIGHHDVAHLHAHCRPAPATPVNTMWVTPKLFDKHGRRHRGRHLADAREHAHSLDAARSVPRVYSRMPWMSVAAPCMASTRPCCSSCRALMMPRRMDLMRAHVLVDAVDLEFFGRNNADRAVFHCCARFTVLYKGTVYKGSSNSRARKVLWISLKLSTVSMVYANDKQARKHCIERGGLLDNFAAVRFQRVLHKSPCGYPTAYPHPVWQTCEG